MFIVLVYKKLTLNIVCLITATLFLFPEIYSQPVASFSTSDDNNFFCKGVDIYFYNETQNCNGTPEFNWDFGDGRLSEEENPVLSFDTGGTFTVTLTVTCDNGTDETSLDIYVSELKADFKITSEDDNDEIYNVCVLFNAKFINLSENDEFRQWFIDHEPFGSGNNIENYTFVNEGTDDIVTTVTLIVEDDNECADTSELLFTTHALPVINILNDTIICPGSEIIIYTETFDNISWSPDEFINNVNISNPTVSPEYDIAYYVEVVDENNCKNNDSVSVKIQKVPEITLLPETDTINAGDTIFTYLLATQDNLTYNWTPMTYISCFNCPEPYIYPEKSGRYTLTVQDSLGCFRNHYYIDIVIKEEYSFDLPKAFTPMGHESNQVVYVRGQGIKNLLQFRIYNRWGVEVFYTDDINEGWDGYYKGELQNIDTYIYFVEIEMIDGKILTKKGNILLMK